ncbi:MAG: type VII secretion target [Mycobacterium sp.]
MRFDRGVRPAAVARTFTRTEVDTSAAYRVATEFDGAAQLIDGALIEHLTRLEFGGPAAGRAHTARGDSLRAELERLTSELSQWSRASSEIAAALRATADRYADAELYAAARIA